MDLLDEAASRFSNFSYIATVASNSQGRMLEVLLPNGRLSAYSLRTAPLMRAVPGGRGHISVHSLRSFVNYCHSLCWPEKVMNS